VRRALLLRLRRLRLPSLSVPPHRTCQMTSSCCMAGGVCGEGEKRKRRRRRQGRVGQRDGGERQWRRTSCAAAPKLTLDAQTSTKSDHFRGRQKHKYERYTSTAGSSRYRYLNTTHYHHRRRRSTSDDADTCKQSALRLVLLAGLSEETRHEFCHDCCAAFVLDCFSFEREDAMSTEKCPSQSRSRQARGVARGEGRGRASRPARWCSGG